MTRRMPCAVWGRTPRCDLGSIGVADIDEQAQSHHGQKHSHMRHYIVQHALHRSVGAQGEHHHDAARPGGYRKCQRIENLLLQRSEAGLRHCGPVGIGLGLVLIQQVPSHGGEHQSSRDLHYGKRNPKKFQQSSSHQLHHRQKKRGADRDFARQIAVNRCRRVAYKAEQYQCRSQRINERQQSAERKRKKLGEKGYASHGCNRIASARSKRGWGCASAQDHCRGGGVMPTNVVPRNFP